MANKANALGRHKAPLLRRSAFRFFLGERPRREKSKEWIS